MASTAAESSALHLSARWIGHFHALNAERLASGALAVLKRYDLDYYLGWIRCTAAFAGDLHECYPWLAGLCARAEDLISLLMDRTPTVIHGEYTVHNILVRGEKIYPIDWESAAVAAGEIDLISLCEGWPPEIARQCEQAYRQARWPMGAPADLDRMLDVARLYWNFRWLRRRPKWMSNEKSRENLLWRFDVLRSAGERLGLI